MINTFIIKKDNLNSSDTLTDSSGVDWYKIFHLSFMYHFIEKLFSKI